MDLNDPRKRLQVVQASSPSLRVAAAPKQNTQPLVVSGAKPVQQAPPPQQSNFINDAIKNIGNFTAGSNEAFLGGTVREGAKALNFLTNGFNADKAKIDSNNFSKGLGLGTDETNSRLNDGTIAPSVDRTGTAFQIGQGVGQGQKVAVDLATAVIPGAGAEKLLSGTMKANEILQGAGLLDKAGRLILPAVGGGVVSSGILQAQDPTQNIGENFGTNAAIDAGVSLLGPAGSIAGRALSNSGIGGAVTDFLGKLGFGSKLKTTAKSLAEVNDETGVQAAIQKILPDLDPQSASDLSKYVAGETDPKAIEATLKAYKDTSTAVGKTAEDTTLPKEDQEAIQAAGGTVAPTEPSVNLDVPKSTTEPIPQATLDQAVKDAGGIPEATPLAKAADITKPADDAVEEVSAATEAQKAIDNPQSGISDASVEGNKKTASSDVAQADVGAKVDTDAVNGVAPVKSADKANDAISQEEMQSIIDTHRKRFGDENVKVESSLHDGQALGAYNNQEDMIKLTAGEHVNSTYNHESVHKVIGKFLSDGEIKQLYNDIVSVRGGKALLTKDAHELGYKGGWKQAAEENIAETFNSFLTDRRVDITAGKAFDVAYWASKHGLPESVANVLQTLAIKIDNFINTRTGKVDAGERLSEFYQNVEKGKFNGAEVIKNSKNTPKPDLIDKALDYLSPPVREEQRLAAVDAGETLAHASDINHPDVQKAIDTVLGSLKGAEKDFADKSKIVAKEKATRINQGGQAFDQAGGGEQGFRAKLGSLKGKHTESKFQAIDASPETQKTILDNIEKSGLREFEKLNTQNAVRKIWGANPEKPTPSDINYIRKYFGEDLGNAVEEAVAQDTKETGWKAVLKKIAATPRAAMATGDISGLGRQGAGLGATDAKAFAKNAKASLEFFAKQENFDAAMTKIKEDDAYALINDKMKVALTGTSGNMEEAFAGENYAENLPKWLGGGLVRGSDRSYAGLLTGLRFDAAKKVIDAAGGPDEYLKVMKNLYGDKADDAMKAYGEAINTLSGRGGKQGGLVDKHMGTLSTTLFAPRLWAANINKINPAWYISLARRNPDAAKLALRGEATHLAMAGTIMGLAAAAGATVGFDPRSADFGKIKFGNTRYDILGGQLQNIVLASRLWTGEKVNSETGEKETLGDGITTPNRVDLLYSAFENKENPLLSFATRLMKTTDGDGGAFDINRKDAYGNEFNLLAEGAKLVTPLGVQGIVDSSIDTGNPITGVAMNLPSFVGAGVQTYGAIPTKDQSKDANGKISFSGEIKPDMVTDNDGKVMLDAKGKPITVKVDKDATPTQIKALKDEARRSAYRAEFVRDQSKEDQALMKLSKEELAQYVTDGTISQDKSDGISRLQKGAETYGGNVDVPNAVTSDVAKNFYKTYNAKSEKDQKAWLDAEPDENAKAISKQLNAQRANGLDEFKPSNKLSKAYADYEKDILSHPEYTNIDKLNKAKAVQVEATKLNYSTDQQDIYQEGPTDDLKSLLSSGQVQKSDLDQAIKIDDQLFASGLTGSLKFSKKFRSENGYGVPSKAGGSGGSGSSTNAHLADYLPSASTAKSKPTPQFSSRSRSPKLAFKNVSTPKASSAKKVTINL